MATTTYGDISQRTAAYAAVDMLSHAEPILVLSKFGQSKPLPKNKADNVKFRRPIPFAVATTPLVEGVTPVAKQMQYEDVAVTIQQYGDVVEITDKVDDLSEDPVLKDASMLCGEQAAETVEMLTWGVLKAGTNVAYANGSARTDVNTVIALEDIRGAVRGLKAQRGKAITSMLAGSPDYATKPVEGGYVAFAHTDLEADLRNLTGFTPVAAYGSRKPLCPEEIGSVENVRFILSPLLSAWADGGGAKGSMKSTTGTNADVYPVIVIAKEAYGLVPLKGEGAITPTVLNPGKPSKSDPLGQIGYVGWKTYFASVRLNEAWMRRIEVAVTAL
jgi:N4-gp56 family major capsid protein